MEQILENLVDPELRKELAKLELADATEQASFEKALGRAKMEFDIKQNLKSRNLVLEQGVRNALRRTR